MQPFDVLEDDTRDWAKAQRKLLSSSLAARLQRELQAQKERVDWSLIASLASNPRGVPVPITDSAATMEQVLAAAPRVRNVLPEGSTWDGKSDLPMDEASFKQMLSETEPAAPGEEGGAAGAASASSCLNETSATGPSAPRSGTAAARATQQSPTCTD